MKFSELQVTESYVDRDHADLDRILKKLCKLIIKAQNKDAEKYGMVAACFIDDEGQETYAVNYKRISGRRIHAEHAALEKYQSKHGKVPSGGVIVTTLSPCSTPMSDRAGADCTEILNKFNIDYVYCGYSDPTQDNSAQYAGRAFEINETSDEKLRAICKRFADTFLEKYK